VSFLKDLCISLQLLFDLIDACAAFFFREPSARNANVLLLPDSAAIILRAILRIYLVELSGKARGL
jgi:hypothetical protein